jgi:hypothetical protein
VHVTENTVPRDPALQELLDKEAIRTALMRYCRGVDRLDADMVTSVYHPDAHDDHYGVIFTGETVGQGLVDWMADTMDSTAHCITTYNIELDGDVAGCESYSTSMHLTTRDGVQRTMMSITRYVDRFERRDGEWRISDRLVVVEQSGYVPVELLGPPHLARRDRSDPSYAVLANS